MVRQQRSFPLTMLATATHDHKRGEDVRARLAVLSEIPKSWQRRVERWSTLNAFRHEDRDGQVIPSRNDEYLLYQTLIGTWPLDVMEPPDLKGSEFADRIVAYMVKAMREAKLETSWLAPDIDYEAGVERFVRGILDPDRARPFMADLLPFQRRVARAGAVTGLAQAVIKLAAPGVPDTYQGTELWDLSLVDPDNRRPVDFERRAANLEDFADADPAVLLGTWRDGRVKQFCIARVLEIRRRTPALFIEGAYVPLAVEGSASEHAIAFARVLNDDLVVVVAPRLLADLIEEERPLRVPAWHFRDTRIVLPEDWRQAGLHDVLSGRERAITDGTLDLGDLFESFPVAVLIPTAPTS
jgi:(1->4)-alpha-D-glucan 1-alpha-D-glucosylmutase